MTNLALPLSQNPTPVNMKSKMLVEGFIILLKCS